MLKIRSQQLRLNYQTLLNRPLEEFKYIFTDQDTNLEAKAGNLKVKMQREMQKKI